MTHPAETYILRRMVAHSAHRHATKASLVSLDGLALSSRHWAGIREPGLVFAHGFGQTHHAWDGTARFLAGEGYDVTTFDARGHGESERLPRGDYHMEQFVADLLTVGESAVSSTGRPPVLVGASMGGLLGLVAAGEAEGQPPFSALILVDITPRWETAGVERILGFMRAHPQGFASYDAAATAIEAYLPQRKERKTEEQLKPLLRQGRDGRLRWHWDPALLDGLLAESERYQPRLFDAAAKVQVPVLLLSGTRSDVVSQHTIDEFLRLVPHAQHVALPDATHMVAGDANDAFTREIVSFMHTLQDEAPAVPRHS